MKRLFDKTELKKSLIIMAPLYVAYMMNTGMSLIDTIVAGSIDEQNLAGVAMGSAVFWPVVVSLGSCLTIIGPMIARLRGANDTQGIKSLLLSGRTIGLGLSIIACLILYIATWIFPYISETAQTARIATHYTYFMILGVPAAILMRVFSSYFEGHDQTRPAMIVAIIALILNYPINHLLAYGGGPIPALGGAGCGLATAILSWLSVVGMLTIMLLTKRHHAMGKAALRYAPLQPVQCKKILRIGLPISIAIFCEVSFFCAISLVIAPLGNIALSAQQVALNISMLFFTLPLTLGIAASIRSSYHIGAQDIERFQRLVSTLIIFVLGTVAITIAIIISFRYQILQLFTQSQDIIAIAQTLLILCAIYQIPDALQALYQGLLRGCHDTKVLSSINIITYWIVGFPLSYILIRTDWIVPAMGPAGAWVSFIVALSLTSALLALRFYKTRRKLFTK